MKKEKENMVLDNNNSNLSQLPKGWVWTPIKNILLSLESGVRPKGGVKNIIQGIPSIGGEHLLYNGGFDFNNIRYIPVDFYEKMTRGKIQPKDVLVVKDGATTGKTAYVPDTFPFAKSAVNEHVFIMRVFKDHINAKYLFFWMMSPYGQKCVNENFQGTAQGGINSSFIENSKIPLPPLPEQHRIVAKIEELFTKLDAGVEALKKIKAQLKLYRQAVLKYAFEGKLTQEWRVSAIHESPSYEPASVLIERIKEQRKKDAKGKHKELPPVDTTNLPELPDGWVWTRLENCVEILDNQRVPINADEREKRILGKSTSELYPYYGATGQVGWIDDYLFDEELVLLGEDGAPFFESMKNKAYIVKGKTWVNNHAHVLKAISDVTLNQFLCHYLNIFDYHGYVTGTTRPKLNQTPMRKIPLPLPPLPEQHKIVEEIERRFSVADEVEKIVEQSLKQAERLRQSILKKAFEGKLVPQDPTDEPAEKLLERIKLEKTKQELKNKRVSKKIKEVR